MSQYWSSFPNEMPLDTRLKVSDLRVYMYLSSCAHRKTRTCYPAQTTIADKLGLTREVVNRSIALLIKCGYITKCDLANGRIEYYLPTPPELEKNRTKKRTELSDQALTGCDQALTGGCDQALTLTIRRTELEEKKPPIPPSSPPAESDTPKRDEFTEVVKGFGFDHKRTDKRLSTQIAEAWVPGPKNKIGQRQIAWGFASFAARARQLGQHVPRVASKKLRNDIRKILTEYGHESWESALRWMDNPHWNGDNDRAWKGNLTTFVREQSFVRLVEGHHGCGKQRKTSGVRLYAMS